ncbi:MAG: hypothetical protein RR348_06695 [Clostridia bacterium]
MIKIDTATIANKIVAAIDTISCEVEPSCAVALAKAREVCS